MLSDQLKHSSFVVRKKIFKLFGGTFYIYDPQGQLVFYADVKAFQLKKDIRLYTDKKKHTEILAIKARQVLDFSATYDVVDSTTNEKIGALRRKGLKSLIQDEWVLLDANEQEIGTIKEDSRYMAVHRRFGFASGTPQIFYAEMSGKTVCSFTQNFHGIPLKLTVNFMDRSGRLDRRMGLAAALLLCAVEGRQAAPI
jgi:uncharacterized protein YxjI